MGIQIEEISKMETQNEAKKGNFIIDESSPRGVLEIPILSPDSVHSCSSSGSSTCSSGSLEKPVPERLAVYHSNAFQWKDMLDAIVKKSTRRFSVISAYEAIARKNVKKKVARIRNSADVLMGLGGSQVPKPSWRNFDSAELAAATDGYNSENLIGEGGHAKVYKGRFPDGQIVAVKKITITENAEEDRIADFLTELGIIAHINHPNAAKLLGFSIDGGLHLVLEYLPHGSLASLLHGGEDGPDWKRRFKVAVGIAEGLKYLHHDCQRRIIHRDITASNILLGEDYEAQISDFGLAKWLPENWLHHVVSPIEGTFGYLAPEYFMNGIVDEKTDVFAYGVLLLEIITGRRAVDSSRQSLVMWAKPLLEANNAKELADPRLGEYDLSEMKRAMLTASMCTHHLPNIRPHMNRVVKLLKGEEVPMELKQRSNAGRAIFLGGWDLQDYTCTSYLNDLNRHKQLVLE